MKKLKLVISDLHAHTGPTLPDGRRNIYEEFLDDDALVEFLDHFSTGEYAEMDVELIVNGDLFNMLEIEFGDGPTEAITEKLAAEQMRRIAAGHPDMFAALRRFAARDHKRLTLIVGNHDAALLFNDVQKLLRNLLGRRVQIQTSATFDGVHIMHGHQFEFIHSFDMRGFTRPGPDGRELLKLPYGSLFVIQYLRPMKAWRPVIDKVKPFGMYLRWAFWNDHLFFWRVVLGIVKFWAVNRFSRDSYRRREFRLSPLRFADAVTHQPLPRHAEEITRRTSNRLVVFGHSHKLDHRTFARGEYYNTGTWTEIISLELAQLGRSYMRPYLRLDYVDGAPHASMHNWLGSRKLTHRLIM